MVLCEDVYWSALAKLLAFAGWLGDPLGLLHPHPSQCYVASDRTNCRYIGASCAGMWGRSQGRPRILAAAEAPHGRPGRSKPHSCSSGLRRPGTDSRMDRRPPPLRSRTGHPLYRKLVARPGRFWPDEALRTAATRWPRHRSQGRMNSCDTGEATSPLLSRWSDRRFRSTRDLGKRATESRSAWVCVRWTVGCTRGHRHARGPGRIEYGVYDVAQPSSVSLPTSPSSCGEITKAGCRLP